MNLKLGSQLLILVIVMGLNKRTYMNGRKGKEKWKLAQRSTPLIIFYVHPA